MNKTLEALAVMIVERLITSFREKDLVATGATIARLRYEVNEDGFVIYGPDYIQDLETGKPPSTNPQENNYEDLRRWAAARGIPEDAVWAIKITIDRFGTRLFRGQDPRFNGKDSKVITDVVNPELIREVVLLLERTVRDEIVTQIVNSIKEPIISI